MRIYVVQTHNISLTYTRKQIAMISLGHQVQTAAMINTLPENVMSLPAQEHAKGGLHSPTCELLFRQFCEALVRVASARYSHIPGIDRRLHVLINTHLLHHVSKNKPGGSTSPLDPFHTHMSTSTEVGEGLRYQAALYCERVPQHSN